MMKSMSAALAALEEPTVLRTTAADNVWTRASRLEIGEDSSLESFDMERLEVVAKPRRVTGAVKAAASLAWERRPTIDAAVTNFMLNEERVGGWKLDLYW